MDFTLIETGAYEELRALNPNKRADSLFVSIVDTNAAGQMDDLGGGMQGFVCIQTCIELLPATRYIPYSMLEKKVYYRESDIHKILRSNLMLPRQ